MRGKTDEAGVSQWAMLQQRKVVKTGVMVAPAVTRTQPLSLVLQSSDPSRHLTLTPFPLVGTAIAIAHSSGLRSRDLSRALGTHPTMNSMLPIEKANANFLSRGIGLSRNRKLNKKHTPEPARQARKPRNLSHRERER